MKTNEEMRKKIMNAVYRIYFFRQFGTPVIRAGIFTVAMLIALSFVSVPHVIGNVAQVGSMTGVIAFFVSAFLKTEFFVQLSLVLAGIVIVWSATDLLTKNIASQRAHAL